jgi:excisionase family DNA binding protein
MELAGKSREQIERATQHWQRHELIDALFKLANCEPWFSPQQVAALRGVSKYKVIDLIRSGVLRAHKPLDNQYRIPLSAVREWDRETALFFVSNGKQNPVEEDRK